ncbi:hypothetical protein CONLIGDRAFT_246229 [Coniochaeta ligniaria NRRL 30616]|uniref:Uncharacterized protein n=1 Tax=Coniochaeta ligniaria NRRL 30616 TaxID=1408157 RepID=A0A1J7IWT4_9PEZI|nr:hypothetical protein CONLIGDRAFT_246229 [Coniochaeta ligniaria NRRL 30616]
MAPTNVQKENKSFFHFNQYDLLEIHELGRTGDLRLEDFNNTILFSFAWKTLGYEAWLRDIRNDFRQRLFQTVKETIEEKELLSLLDKLAGDLDNRISLMKEKSANPSEPPSPIEKALLIRAKNKTQAEEATRYLEAAEVALGQVIPFDPTTQRRDLSRYHRDRAEEFHLPALKTYHRQRARYLDYLVHSPGTPFYPGRPPKRKIEAAAWYPAGRRRRDTRRSQPWRPIYRPWVDGSGDTDEADDFESRIAGRKGLKRKADELETGPKRSRRPGGTLLPAAPPPTPAKLDLTRLINEGEGEEDEFEQYKDTESEEGLWYERTPKPDPVCLASFLSSSPLSGKLLSRTTTLPPPRL